MHQAGTFSRQLGWVFVGPCHPSVHGPPALTKAKKQKGKPNKSKRIPMIPRVTHTQDHKHTCLSSFLQASTTNTKTQEESPESPSVESRICLQIGHLLLPGIMVRLQPKPRIIKNMVRLRQSHGHSSEAITLRRTSKRGRPEAMAPKNPEHGTSIPPRRQDRPFMTFPKKPTC